MDITLTDILIFFAAASIFYLGQVIAKKNKQNNISMDLTNKAMENLQRKMYGQEYDVMHIPEAPEYTPDEIITAYDNELDDITKKLEIYPSPFTADERRALNSRYDELIGLMVNRFAEKSERTERSNVLMSLKKNIKGDNHAN